MPGSKILEFLPRGRRWIRLSSSSTARDGVDYLRDEWGFNGRGDRVDRGHGSHRTGVMHRVSRSPRLSGRPDWPTIHPDRRLRSSVSTGSLTVVGTGIAIGGHLTPEARGLACRARRRGSLSSSADPVAAAGCWRRSIPRARSLHTMYETGRTGFDAYEAMVDEILVPASRRAVTSARAFYGHPGIFVYPGHEARAARAPRRLRQRGMLPGISVPRLPLVRPRRRPGARRVPDLPRDRLRAPGRAHARHQPRRFILLQINVVGQPAHVEQPDWSRLPRARRLPRRFYPADHEVIGYEASPFSDRARLSSNASRSPSWPRRPAHARR